MVAIRILELQEHGKPWSFRIYLGVWARVLPTSGGSGSHSSTMLVWNEPSCDLDFGHSISRIDNSWLTSSYSTDTSRNQNISNNSNTPTFLTLLLAVAQVGLLPVALVFVSYL